MRLLLDTHVLVWWLEDAPQLSAQAARAIANPRNDVFASAASAWELSIKRAAGKLDLSADLSESLRNARVEELSITFAHGFAAGALPRHHDDPFDRLLVAQAQLEGLVLVTVDSRLNQYDVRILEQ